MDQIVIEHPHNEASALVRLKTGDLLEQRGWDLAFWIVSDEMDLEHAVAAMGRTADGKWEIVPLATSISGAFATSACEDCETVARAGNVLYILGSQFGSKKGPLQPKRHFIARFNEALLTVKGGKPAVELEVARRPFVLHRLINDALRAQGIEAMPLPQAMQDALVGQAVMIGKKDDKAWKDLVREDDLAIDVEGSAFIDDGVLLLGLRYPVTADGHPILVEIEGIDRLFVKKGGLPVVTAVRVLRGVGSRLHPSGVRELDAFAGAVHVLTGALDEEHLGDAREARAEHWMFHTPWSDDTQLTCVRRFGHGDSIEGIAVSHETTWYVHDDAQIRMEWAPTIAAEPGAVRGRSAGSRARKASSRVRAKSSRRR